ncbi:MAG: D-threonine aldolase, partial [Baekduia sp.]|nr:D-threonine aldolase [Baekduia sp.]
MTTAATTAMQARYGDQIGRARNEVSTPALLLDLDKAKRNIATMAAKFRELPADLRPHFKAHKSPQLARLQVEAGAIGVACATAWEAIVVAEAGISDVLIANQLVQPDKVRAVAELARSHRLTVAVDDVRNAEQLSRAAVEAGAELELLIELDVG